MGIAARILGDHFEAEDVVQQAWLRLRRHNGDLDSLPAWLTTVTTRLCLDRLRAKTPVPSAHVGQDRIVPDVGEDVALAESVGVALQAVLDRLSPQERVAFVLHDSFGFEFSTIAAVLDITSVAARKLASRARAKVCQPVPQNALPDWEIVDVFMDAARNGNFGRLLGLLAPEAGISADEAAARAGAPEQIDGRHEVATFFNGRAHAALRVFYGSQPAAAWFHRGEPRVLFDFTMVDGLIVHITFRADAAALREITRRR